MPTKTPEKRSAVAIYCRLSSDRGLDSVGIDRQQELCLKIVEERGWQVAEVYVDRDISAYRGKRRPSFQRLLEDVRDGSRDAVVAIDQDRLTRQLTELAQLLDDFSRLGVPIVLASGELDTSSADGRLRAQILGAVAENESAKKSERIRRQREQLARSGAPMRSRRAFGYEPDGETVRRSEADIVTEAVDNYLRGESIPAICRDLNRRGSRSATGREWQETTMRCVLINPRYAGLRVHRGEVIGDANWPSIIDRESHNKIVARLNDPRHPKKGRPPASLLTGNLRCGKCGTKLSSTKVGGQRRWVCNLGPGRPGCGKLSVVGPPIEALIEAAIVRQLSTPRVAKAMSKPRKATTRTPEPNIADLELDLELLAADLGAGRISRREWIAAREGIEARLSIARAEAATDDAGTALGSFANIDDVAAVWNSISVELQRKVLGVLIESITVAGGRPGRRHFDPARVSVAWKM